MAQNDSERPILPDSQLFQSFPTKVAQNDSEWPILPDSQLFQSFPIEVAQNGQFCMAKIKYTLIQGNFYEKLLFYMDSCALSPMASLLMLEFCFYRAQLARMANLDASWATTNSLATQGNPTWLNLYLAACKLLDVALILPSEIIPQFQLYKWAFTGDPGLDEQPPPSDKNKRAKEQPQQPVFVPHVFRISKLMNLMVG